jgi:hypothetical protein
MTDEPTMGQNRSAGMWDGTRRTDKLRCSFLLAEGVETAWWQTAPCAGVVMLPGKRFARAL